MNRKYPLELRKKAIAMIDAGKSPREVAKKLDLNKNTLYAWNAGNGRQELATMLADGLEAIARVTPTSPMPRPRPIGLPPPIDYVPPRKRPVVRALGDGGGGPEMVDESNAGRIAALERENTVLKKLLDIYKEAAGL